MLPEVFEILCHHSQGSANSVAHRILFTAGYGNQPEPDFIARLKSYDVNFVFDVRRKESRSWNPAYFPGNSRIGLLFRRNRIPYWPLLFFNPRYDLGNRLDTLADYENWLHSERNLIPFFESLAAFIEGNIGIIPCLLCAERSHEKCHRTIVAEQLLGYINEITSRDHTTSWIIKHI